MVGRDVVNLDHILVVDILLPYQIDIFVERRAVYTSRGISRVHARGISTEQSSYGLLAVGLSHNDLSPLHQKLCVQLDAPELHLAHGIHPARQTEPTMRP